MIILYFLLCPVFILFGISAVLVPEVIMNKIGMADQQRAFGDSYTDYTIDPSSFILIGVAVIIVGLALALIIYKKLSAIETWSQPNIRNWFFVICALLIISGILGVALSSSISNKTCLSESQYAGSMGTGGPYYERVYFSSSSTDCSKGISPSTVTCIGILTCGTGIICVLLGRRQVQITRIITNDNDK